jgi:RNA polymerase sigma factor (sigma-70 family)
MSPRFPDPARFAGSRLLRVQSDERLVALTRDGYEAAFSAIVDRYRTPLERYATRIVGDSRAEDAVQQAFANAHRALIRDDRPIALKAWLYRITHNAALNQLRAIRDDVALDDESFGRPATAMATAHDTISVVELQARLRETLDLISALPPNQRDALLLAELEGRSHEEIAIALDIPSETVRHRVMQARTTLRAAVSALVPYPIAAQLAAAAASGSETARTAAELAAGAGAGAVAIKITAGLTATGALVAAFAVPSIDTRSIDHDAAKRGVAREAAASAGRTQVASSAPFLLDGTRSSSGAVSDAAATSGASIDAGQTGDSAGAVSENTLGLGELLPASEAAVGFAPAPVAGSAPATHDAVAPRRSGTDGKARSGTDRKDRHARIDGAGRDSGRASGREQSAAPAAPGSANISGPGNGPGNNGPGNGPGGDDKPSKDPGRGASAPDEPSPPASGGGQQSSGAAADRPAQEAAGAPEQPAAGRPQPAPPGRPDGPRGQGEIPTPEAPRADGDRARRPD